VNLPAPSFSSKYKTSTVIMNTNEKDSASMSCEQYAATTSSYHLDKRMRLQNIMTVHVRWPAKNSGAFVFGCTFLWSFLLCKQKKGQAVCIKTKKRKELKKKILY